MDNQGRADRIAEAMARVYDEYPPSSAHLLLTEVLADMRHLCKLDGLDFEKCLSNSDMLFKQDLQRAKEREGGS